MLDDDFFESIEQADTDERILPAFTALIVRSVGPFGPEGLWIHGYPGVRMVIVTAPRTRTLPGVVRELPVGPRDMRDAETFRAFCERIVHGYIRLGWERRETGVRG